MNETKNGCYKIITTMDVLDPDVVTKLRSKRLNSDFILWFWKYGDFDTD